MPDETLGNSEDAVTISALELRTALQSILGFTQLLAVTGDNLTRIQRRYLTTIESAAGQLLAHTGGPRPGRLLFERIVIDLDAAIAGALDQVSPVAEAAGVRLEAERSGFTILGDREQVEQMLVSLLSCAARSTPASATVRVRAQRQADRVQLSITDTGIAIPRELTAARRLAEVLGGVLEWTHEADDRTGISIRLPAPVR